MKKVLVAIALVAVMTGVSFAAGPVGLDAIGLQEKSYNNFGMNNLGLTAVWNPVSVGLDFSFWNGIYVSGSFDWWIYKGVISGPFEWYAFPGIYAGAGIGASTYLYGGFRLGGGIQFTMFKPFELFIEPALGVGIFDTRTASVVGIWPHLQLAAGLRFWF